jgi:hypothetical protein
MAAPGEALPTVVLKRAPLGVVRFFPNTVTVAWATVLSPDASG